MPPAGLSVCSLSPPGEAGLFLETDQTFHGQQVIVNYLHVPPTPREACIRMDQFLSQSCPRVGLSVKNWGWEEKINKLLQSPREENFWSDWRLTTWTHWQVGMGWNCNRREMLSCVYHLHQEPDTPQLPQDCKWPISPSRLVSSGPPPPWFNCWHHISLAALCWTNYSASLNLNYSIVKWTH